MPVGGAVIFADGEAEMAEGGGEAVILAVGIGQQAGVFQAEFAGLRVYVAFVGAAAEHFGQNHVVAAQAGNLFYPALD